MVAAFCLDLLDATSSTKSLGRPIKKDLLPFVAICDSTHFPISFYKPENQTTGSMNTLFYVRPSINIDQLVTRSESLGYAPIDNDAVRFSHTLAEYLDINQIVPSNVFPLADGGITLEIQKDDTYYNLEVANNGEASFYKEKPNETPEGWEYSYIDLISRLQREFNG